MSSLLLENVRAEALFVSNLQSSDSVTAEVIRSAIARSVRQHGARGCAALVAHEFGEHPETAAARMAWVLSLVRQPSRR